MFLTACSTPAKNNLKDESDSPTHYADGHAIVFDEGEYDDYLEHFKTAENVPNDLIFYEQIEEFGSFKQFYAVSNSRDFAYDIYYYTLTDNCGHDFAIKIMNHKPTNGTPNSTTAINPQDMRYLNENSGNHQIYLHDRISYSYSNGQLTNISWQVENHHFSITFEPGMLSTFGPNHNGTLIGGMLSLDTANSTYDTFAEQIKSTKIPE